MAFTIKINGTDHTVDVDGDTPLLWVLRDVLGMTGTKFGCGVGLCGACTVHVAGNATRSCITTIDSVGASAVTTIEAVGDRRETCTSHLLRRPQCTNGGKIASQQYAAGDFVFGP
jgi:aerobic-type carbon monoxide dehydrogenase small subunit (CoxS/CutS family)